MVAVAGRVGTLEIEDSPGSGTYTPLANLTSITININNNLVDITNKSSAGWQERLGGAGTRNRDLGVEGILTFTTEQTLFINNARDDTVYNYRVKYGDPEQTITGAYGIANLSITTGVDDAQTFSGTLESSGVMTEA